MNLGVQNFRVFKEHTEFDIRPITILVGPNNSGKSSFTKLLLLLKNGWNPLNFKVGDHHLGSYEKALNWDTENEELLLSNEVYYPLLPDYFVENIRYNKEARVNYLSINSLVTKQSLLTYEVLKFEEELSQVNEVLVSLDIEYLIDLLYNEKLLVNVGRGISLDSLENDDNILDNKINDEYADCHYSSKININNYINEKFSITEGNMNKRSAYITNSVLINALKEVNRDYLLIDVFVNDQQLQNKEKLRRIQKEVFDNLKILLHVAYKSEQSTKSFFKHIYSQFKYEITKKITNEYKDIFSETDEKPNIEIKETLLGRLIFSEKLYFGIGDFFMDLYSSYFNATLFEHIYDKMFIQLNEFKNVEYIAANRGSQNRVLSVNTNEETFKSSVKYHELQKNKSIPVLEQLFLEASQTKSPNVFLENLLSIIGINGKVSTEVFEDSVIAIYIEQDERKINLADYGFGYSQLIPIILKIYNLRRKNITSSILIIEEPEANLHPNLQSKLADILKFVIKENERWKIVVETHSEYLIRKLQYLVADSQLKTEDCIIHYFNTDVAISVLFVPLISVC